MELPESIKGMTIDYIRSDLKPQRMADGQRLFLRDWPVAQARQAVLLVHGLGEHSGRYEKLAEWFNLRGYDVRGYDQRGHGLSRGQRGGLPRAEVLIDDLAEIYAAFAADRAEAPLLLGHSMGGLVALRAVLSGRVHPSRLVLSAPVLRTWESAWRQRLAAVLARVAPWLPAPNGLRSDKLSHDPAVVRAYLSDPLRHGRITPRLGNFIIRGGASCIADAAKLATPTLLLIAGADALVDPAGSRAFAAAAPAAWLRSVEFAGLYHELFNEAMPGRSEVLANLQQWLA